MRTRSRRGIIAIGLVAALWVGAGCSDDDGNPAGPGGQLPGGNPTAAAFLAISQAASDFVLGNADMINSLVFFAPVMEASFNVVGGGAPTSPASQTSCLPPNLANKVFRYDSQTDAFVEDTNETAPTDAVKYYLNEVVFPTGPTANVIGHLIVVCTGPSPISLQLTVVSGTTTVLDLPFTGTANLPDFNLYMLAAGMMRSPSTPPFGVYISANGTLNPSDPPNGSITENLSFNDLTGYNAALDGFEARIHRWDTSLDGDGLPTPGFDGFGFGVSAYQNGETAQRTSGASSVSFGASAGGSVDNNGNMLNVLFGSPVPMEWEDYDAEQNGILACWSGQYDDPLVESSDVACATGVIQNPVPSDQATRDTYKAGYLGLLTLLDLLTPIWSTGLQALAGGS